MENKASTKTGNWKYRECLWHMKTVIPVVVGVLGTSGKGMVEIIKKVSEAVTVTEFQKICIMGTV